MNERREKKIQIPNRSKSVKYLLAVMIAQSNIRFTF